jgi:hypothetical protein
MMIPTTMAVACRRPIGFSSAGCGRWAVYHQLARSWCGGEAAGARHYSLGPNCHTGQFPADIELGIENTEFSPGVRRLQALVGQAAPFDHGREQIQMLLCRAPVPHAPSVNGPFTALG